MISLLDFNHKIAESDESNNSKALLIHIVKPNVDLKTYKPKALRTTSVGAGATNGIEIECSEKNIGTTPAFERYMKQTARETNENNNTAFFQFTIDKPLIDLYIHGASLEKPTTPAGEPAPLWFF